MVVALFITLVMLPVEVAFFTCVPDNDDLFMRIITVLTDAIFMVDIVINFMTGYVPSSQDKVRGRVLAVIVNSVNY